MSYGVLLNKSQVVKEVKKTHIEKLLSINLLIKAKYSPVAVQEVGKSHPI